MAIVDCYNGLSIIAMRGTMIHPEVAQHIPAIRDLCREFGVLRLEIFGSATTDAFDPARSDVDFLVTYPEGYVFGIWLKNFFDFEQRLADTVGRRADLIMSTAPRRPRFVQNIDATREVVYDADTHARVA